MATVVYTDQLEQLQCTMQLFPEASSYATGVCLREEPSGDIRRALLHRDQVWCSLLIWRKQSELRCTVFVILSGISCVWTSNKDIATRLAAFEGKVLRGMFWGIRVNENWRKRYIKEFMQLFRDLDILSDVRLSRLNWIRYVNRMDSKIKASQISIVIREVD